MPTGYTSIFEDEKNTTFADFLWRCARGMGAFIHQRDESLANPPRKPDWSGKKFAEKSDSYHVNGLKQARKELEAAQNLTLEEAARQSKVEYAKAKEEWDNSCLKKRVLHARLLKILGEARGWTPPTPEHEGLKKFMIEQLELTLPDYEIDDRWAPKLRTAKEYKEDKIRAAKWGIDYHSKHLERDEERDEDVSGWIDQLQDSVPYPGGRL